MSRKPRLEYPGAIFRDDPSGSESGTTLAANANSLTETFLENRHKFVEEALVRWLPRTEPLVDTLGDAMRYCVFPGGKRLRPKLVIAAAQTVGGSVEAALPAAAALEFIHTSSLIYDDLPCMDGAEMRRDKPACHRVFGEAVALLAAHCLFARGMALCCHEDMARSLCPLQLSRLLDEVASAVGPSGLAGGQFLDLLVRNSPADCGDIRLIQARKTGSLIRLAFVLGGLTAGVPDSVLECLSTCGECIGLAFQIRDDLLDDQFVFRKQDNTTAGRQTPSVLETPGYRAAWEEEIDALTTKAKIALRPLGSRAHTLELFADYLAVRKS